jgi:hypothetical protein
VAGNRTLRGLCGSSVLAGGLILISGARGVVEEGIFAGRAGILGLTNMVSHSTALMAGKLAGYTKEFIYVARGIFYLAYG